MTPNPPRGSRSFSDQLYDDTVNALVIIVRLMLEDKGDDMTTSGRTKRYVFLIERLPSGSYCAATIADLLTEADLKAFKVKHGGGEALTLPKLRLRARTALGITRRRHIKTPSPGKVTTKRGASIDGWPSNLWKKAFGLNKGGDDE